MKIVNKDIENDNILENMIKVENKNGLPKIENWIMI